MWRKVESNRIKNMKETEIMDFMVCAPAEGYDYERDVEVFKENPSLQSVVRGLVCSKCGNLVVTSEEGFKVYQKDKPKVICGVCFFETLEK